MKRIRNCICALFLALIIAVLLHGGAALRQPGRVWVGNTDLSGGGSCRAGSGTAEYDPASRTLTLTDAEITSGFRGSGVFSESSLTIRLQGSSRISGERSGITVLGQLHIYGGGSLRAEGGVCGISVRDSVVIFDAAELLARGSRALRWGELHASPMDTVERTAGSLLAKAPYTVTLRDAGQDAAGHLLYGPGLFERFQVRMDEAIPMPATPEREGYWFGGWYEDARLSAPFDFSRPRSGDTDLYARWIQIVTLRFDSWSGSEVAPVYTAWGEAPVLPAAPSREGYRFAGWYRDSEFRTPFDGDAGMTGDETVYARWDKLAAAVSRGIDVARYQGEIDWEAVRADGVEFVFIRAGYRGYGEEGTLNTDDNFLANLEGAQAAGLDTGVYFFSQAVTPLEAEAEADYLLQLLEGHSLTLPVVMDYELASNPSGGLLGRLYDANLSGAQHANNCVAFCRAMEAAGYNAAVYAGVSMLEDEVGRALEEGGFPVWLAHWTVQPRYNGSYDYWQYSATGRVDGITGDVDLNLRYVQEPEQVQGLTLSRQEGMNFLFWDRVPGAEGYIIYRSEPDGSGYGEYARRSGAGSVTFSDYDAPEGCRYLVCAYQSLCGKDYRGPFSESVG